jgi:hypothetical protein
MKVPLILLVIFGIFLSLPATFRTTRDLLGSWVADAQGDPTGAGFFFHSLVLVIVVLGFSKTVSTFVQPAFAKPMCKVAGAPSSSSPCPAPETFDPSDVGQKCRTSTDPKGVALGWVQPDLVSCNFNAPPAPPLPTR